MNLMLSLASLSHGARTTMRDCIKSRCFLFIHLYQRMRSRTFVVWEQPAFLINIQKICVNWFHHYYHSYKLKVIPIDQSMSVSITLFPIFIFHFNRCQNGMNMCVLMYAAQLLIELYKWIPQAVIWIGNGVLFYGDQRIPKVRFALRKICGNCCAIVFIFPIDLAGAFGNDCIILLIHHAMTAFDRFSSSSAEQMTLDFEFIFIYSLKVNWTWSSVTQQPRH